MILQVAEICRLEDDPFLLGPGNISGANCWTSRQYQLRISQHTDSLVLKFSELKHFEPAWAVAPTCWILAFSLLYLFFLGGRIFSKVRDWNTPVISIRKSMNRRKSWQFCEKVTFFWDAEELKWPEFSRRYLAVLKVTRIEVLGPEEVFEVVISPRLQWAVQVTRKFQWGPYSKSI